MAAVIYNRLSEKMPLGIDASTRFAVNKWTGPLTKSDLEDDSPYNTRKAVGLPPGPIASPGLAVAQGCFGARGRGLSVLRAEDDAGNHFFTRDYEEFLQARRTPRRDAGPRGAEGHAVKGRRGRLRTKVVGRCGVGGATVTFRGRTEHEHKGAGGSDLRGAPGWWRYLGTPLLTRCSPRIHNVAFAARDLDLCYLAFDVQPDRLGEAVGGLVGARSAGGERDRPLQRGCAASRGTPRPPCRTGGSGEHPGVGGGPVRRLQHGRVRLPYERGTRLGHGRLREPDVWCWVLEERLGRWSRASCESAPSRYGCTTAPAVAPKPSAEPPGTGARRRARPSAIEELRTSAAAADLIVNATSAGCTTPSRNLAVFVDRVGKKHMVMELLYGTRTSDLLRGAQLRGALTSDGAEMLVQQATVSFELWTGIPAPVELMRQEVKRA